MRPKIVRKRRWFQISLRTFFLWILLCGVGIGWLGPRIDRARKQEMAVAAVAKLGGTIGYDYQVDQSGKRIAGAKPAVPAWLRSLVGDHFFVRVTHVDFEDRKITDADLAGLEPLADLRLLDLSSTSITDAGLVHLKTLRSVRQLELDATNVTDSGLGHLTELTNLTELDLRFTGVSESGLRHLSRLPALERLWVIDTKLTQAGAKRLRTLMRDTIITSLTSQSDIIE